MYLLPAVASGPPLLDVIHHCDALTLLRALPDESVDLIVTDPPYGIGYASSWTTRMDGSLRQSSGTFGADVFDDTWVTEAARVLASHGALYMFTRWDVLHLWKDAIEAAGLAVKQRLVWDKCHWGMGDLEFYGSQTEDVLFAVKNGHRLAWEKREGNVWRYPSKGAMRGHEGMFDHPTQKSVRPIKKAIEYSCPLGGIVLDPFMGSGTTAVAARDLGRHYLGCDISAKYVDMARARLALPYTLPMFA